MARLDFDRAARVLVDAALLGDWPACKRHGISLRTLQRWRRRLADDPNMAQLVAQKKELLDRAWADNIPSAIQAAVAYLTKAAQETTTYTPEMVHAIAGALKMLSEVGMAREILDERFARQNRQNGKPT